MIENSSFFIINSSFIKVYTSTSKLEKIYRDCSVARNREGEKYVSVPGFTGGPHVFRKDELEKHYMSILSAVKGLPEKMRYSHSREGMPWIMARHHRKMGDITVETAERLAAMAVALGIMRIVHHDNIPCDVPYVVIDDERIRKREIMECEGIPKKGLTRWNRIKTYI